MREAFNNALHLLRFRLLVGSNFTKLQSAHLIRIWPDIFYRNNSYQEEAGACLELRFMKKIKGDNPQTSQTSPSKDPNYECDQLLLSHLIRIYENRPLSTHKLANSLIVNAELFVFIIRIFPGAMSSNAHNLLETTEIIMTF